MTNSTDSKNIKVIIQSILQKHKIDSLQLELDFFGAWMRYMNERGEGLTPAQVRLNITAEYNELGISSKGIARNQLKARMETALGLEIDEGVRNWETVINHCLKSEAEGQTIEKFCQWCKSDPFNSPKKHQIAQNPLLIKTMWRSAFAENESIEKTRLL